MHTFRLRNAGNSISPAIIIIAALAISAAVFFLFTRPQMKEKQAAHNSQAAASQTPDKAGPAPATAADPTKPAMTIPGETKAVPPVPGTVSPASAKSSDPQAPAVSMTFAQPGDVATQVAKAIADGDIAMAAKLAAAGDPAQEKTAAAVLDRMTKGMGFKIGPLDKIQVLGQAGEATRVSIPLIRPGETIISLSMQLDVVRDPQTGWRVAQFRLPKELQAVVAETTAKMVASGGAAPALSGSTAGALPTGTPSTALPGMVRGSSERIAKGIPLFTVENNPDPLGVAHVFVQALLNQDYTTARTYVNNEKVPDQKLAGLCIVFEEGAYQLRPGKPLVMTIASESEAWVIAQIRSEKLQQMTEFGLEMQQSESKQWRIVGLNLSDLLGSFAKSADKLGVPYTPLVKNPSGGESLALYFEYDRAELHPRAEKQLEIVANLLNANASRKLRIAGHTDAKGTDTYNLSLSSRRALAVKLKLAALGVSPDQVITVGLGKTEPIGPNQKADGTDDPDGRSRNRRAEIFLDF